MTRIAGVQLMLMLMVIAGCGRDGSGAGGRHVTWQDEGTAKKALLTIASKAVSGTTDSREIIGTASDVGVAIYVSATAPLTAQTFDCSQLAGQTANVSYNEGDGGLLLSMLTCTVNLTQAGDVGGQSVVGTFAATFSIQAGGTKNITNGSFNVPVTQ